MRRSKFQWTKLGNFSRDRKGVAAVEFALILPLLLIMLIGMAETTEGLSVNRKLNQIASTMSDLAAQKGETIRKNDLKAYFKGANSLMSPHPTNSLYVVLVGIQLDDKAVAKVAWSYDSRNSAPYSKGSKPSFTIPDELKVKDSFLIVGRAEYNYKPTFASLAQTIMPRAKSIEMEETYFFYPRQAETVDCPDCS